MEITQLKYFAYVAKLCSFTAASQRLSVAQSALSRQIKALEDELGVLLLARTTHSVRPTEAGHRLLEMSDFVLHYIDQIPAKLRETASEPAGSVVVGLLPSVADIITPSLLKHAQKSIPNVSIRVSEGLAVFLRERLLLGQVDLAVLTAGANVKGLSEMQVVDEEMVLTGDERLLSRFEDPIDLADLAGVPIISTEGFKEIVQTAARAAGVVLRFEMEQNSLTALKMMLRQGFGVSILPYAVVHEETQEERLAIRRIVRPRLTRSLATVRPEFRPPSRALDAVAGILAEELLRLPALPGIAAQSRRLTMADESGPHRGHRLREGRGRPHR